MIIFSQYFESVIAICQHGQLDTYEQTLMKFLDDNFLSAKCN